MDRRTIRRVALTAEGGEAARRRQRRVVLGMALGLWAGLPMVARAATLTVGGVGAAMPLMERLADLYRAAHPDSRVTVVLPPMGSSGALRALAASRIDVAVVGRTLQPGETGSLRTWLRTPLAFATSDGMLAGLDAAKVAAVYAGRLTRWDDNRPLRLILRGAQESETLALRSLSAAIDEAVGLALERRDLPMPGDDLEAQEFLARIPGSFGTTAFGLSQLRPAALRLLPLGGVAPGIESLAEGRYPLSRPYHLVHRPGAPAEVMRLLAFLQSPASLKLARSLGHLAVER